MSEIQPLEIAPFQHEPRRTSTPVAAMVSRGFKRRASKACSFCQWRKIRCNVEERHPCSNCILEGIECSITKTRKSKKVKSNQLVLNSEQLAERQNILPDRETNPVEDIAAADLADLRFFPSDNNVEEPSTQEEQASLPAYRPESIVQGPLISLTRSLASASPHDSSDASLGQGAAKMALPDFLEPIPTSLPPEDLEYLHKKGCFDIPALKFREAIYRSYAEYFHPYMPLLDLGRFLHMVTSQEPQKPRVSLLLFQAIMFAGSAHVDIKPLRMLGFLTRKAARRALYIKTKALYDMDYEQDRLCVIIVLVIMSHWYETPDDQKDACHWLQIALSLSRRAGLDRNPATMAISEGERRMRKRIWWSVVNRDPLCALGLKSRLTFQPRDHDVPDLTVEDFELENVPKDGFEQVGIWPPGKRRLLCLASVSQSRLHKHLYDILNEQYRLGDYRSASRKTEAKSTNMVLLPVTTESTRANLQKLENNLQSWRDSLPSELQTTTVGSEISDSGFESFVVFRTVLHMLYHTSLITLYRPWLRQQHSVLTIDRNDTEFDFTQKIQALVRSSAQAITDLAVDLHRLDLIRHLPQTGISALVAAVVSHISDVLSYSEDIQRAGLKGFEQCSHLLNELRENYYSADFCFNFIELLAQARSPKEKPRMSKVALGLDGGALEDQISALSGFIAAPIQSDSSNPKSTPVPPTIRTLPEALFPEGVDFTTRHPHNEDANWGLQAGFEDVVDGNHTMIPLELTEDWEYFRNFRDETARLLGDFCEDFESPGLAGPINEINALSG